MAELLTGSAETWRTEPAAPRLPAHLLDRPRGPLRRLRALLARHHARTAHAREVYRDSRAPKQGFPVASSRTAVGFLGGFTTFSAFSLDTVSLIERGQWGAAALYIALSIILCVGGLFAGLLLTRGLAG